MGLSAIYCFILAIFSSGKLEDPGPITTIIEQIAASWQGKVLFALVLWHIQLWLGRHIWYGLQKPSRLSFILKGNFFLCLGLGLFLLGLYLSLITREAIEVFPLEGETLTLNKQDGKEMSRYSWLAGGKGVDRKPFRELTGLSFQLNRVESGLTDDLRPYPRNIFISHSPQAELFLLHNSIASPLTIGTYPPRVVQGLYFSLTYFGFAPGIMINRRDREPLYQGFVQLRIFPPGLKDQFQIPELGPYKFFLGLAPLGQTGPRFPTYQLKIIKESTKGHLYDGIVKPGQRIAFDGLELIIAETRYWVGIGITRDKGLSLAGMGFALLILGGMPKVIWLTRRIGLSLVITPLATMVARPFRAAIYK